MIILPGSHTTETKWSTEFGKALREQCGALVLSVQANEHSSGWPDKYVHAAQFQGFIELKRFDNEMTTQQKLRIEALNKYKHFSACVIYLEQFGSKCKLCPSTLHWPSRESQWYTQSITHISTVYQLLQILGSLQNG